MASVAKLKVVAAFNEQTTSKDYVTYVGLWSENRPTIVTD